MTTPPPMDGPLVDERDWVEMAGILAVSKQAHAARCIWRETPTRDVGIDGQIEYVLDGKVASGRIVAVQVKSGRSHWRRQDDGHVIFSPEPKHRAYWERSSLPVIVVLHDEGSDRTIWADARAQLRDGASAIRVPLVNTLDADGMLAAMSVDGALPAARMTPAALLADLSAHRHLDAGFGLSYLDLFAGGMTSLAKVLYFGMDLVVETQETLVNLPGGRGLMSMGESEYRFLDDYVAYLIAHNIARVDFDGWRRMNARFGMVGQWFAPLTVVGEELVDHACKAHPDVAGIFQERSVELQIGYAEPRIRMQCELARRLTEEEVTSARDGSRGS